MSAPLPPGIQPGDEIEVTWKRGENKTRVTASLGGATIRVTTDHESAQAVPWLAASLPKILEAAWAAIDNESTTKESP